VFVLGSLRLAVGSQTLVPSPGAGRLLGFLAVTPVAPREEVAAALWPDGTGNQAGTALRTALSRLRHELGAGWVATHNRELELSDDIWCDCRALENAVHNLAGHEPDLSSAQEALRLYTGDAFRGWYEGWALATRARLRDLALLGYERLVEQACLHHDWDLALEAGLSGAVVDPLVETFHRGIMLAHGHRGNPASVIRQFSRAESVLSAELGVRPSRATRQALERALAAARADDTGPRRGEPTTARSAGVALA
jgi:DNA-binding SARP family transcriptional activator